MQGGCTKKCKKKKKKYYYRRVKCCFLALRKSPGVKPCNKLCLLAKGTLLKVLKKVVLPCGSVWLCVKVMSCKHTGAVGWVYKKGTVPVKAPTKKCH
jgi:hypothetical protein